MSQHQILKSKNTTFLSLKNVSEENKIYITHKLRSFRIKELKSPKYHFDNYRYTIDNKKDVVFVKKIMSLIKKDDLYKFRNINKIYKKLIK